MPGFNIHLAIAKRYMDKHNDIKDKIAFYEGSIAPDFTGDKNKSHYTAKNRNNTLNYSSFLLKKVILSKYLKSNQILSDYDKGIFLHLITDKIFFGDFFDTNYLDNVDIKYFLRCLYYSYDLLNDYIRKKYVNIYDIFDKSKIDDILKNYKSSDLDKESIISKEKIDEFIELVSDISIDEYKNKVLHDDMHEMKLNSSAFDRMKNGIKKREYRVNDEKRRKVKRGDIITFKKLPDLDEELEMIVTNVEIFNNFTDAVTPYFITDFSDRYETIEELVESFYSRGYYDKDEVEKYGAVVFTLERIN